MATLYFDIETLPCADEALLADVLAKVAPPKTLKKPESIDAWWAEEGEAAKAEAVARTALDGALGRICCIGWAIDDAPAIASIGDERAVIEHFFGACDDAAMVPHYSQPVSVHTVVGHNVAGFDLRYIWQRCVVLGIPRPRCIPWAEKPWSDKIRDTMLMWHPDRERRIGLDRLCRVLGIQTSKSDLDGSKIAQAWADGRYDDIAAYCRADVEATRACYRRMT